MKKEVKIFAYVFLFLSIFLSQNVLSANSCSSTDQIIFRINSELNAHAEIFNGDGAYTTEICYNQLFSNAPTPGQRECNNNEVLRLSANTNAHAEEPNENNPGYFNVCYRDLKCTLKSSCNSNEVEVVRLSGKTNAHLQLVEESDYDQVLCCTSQSAPGQACQPACSEGKICSQGQCFATPSNSAQCGNGKIDAGEGCDGSNFGGKTCASLIPSSSGVLTCNQCVINTGACITSQPVNPECSDGLDNDNDGKIDYGNDPGCSSISDDTEAEVVSGANAYWADNNENELANRAEVTLGTRVTLIARGVPAQSRVTFTILDKDGLLGKQEIREFRNIDSTGAITKVSWVPTLADFNNGLNALEGNELELYFQARASGYTEESKEIVLKNIVNDPTLEGCIAYNDEAYMEDLDTSLSQEESCNRDIGNQLSKDSAYSSANSDLQIKFGVGCNKETINSEGRRVITTCVCIWQANECKFSYSHKTLPIGGTGSDPNICAPKCEYSYDEEQCNGNFKILTLSRDLGDLNNCTPDEIDKTEENCPEQEDVKVDCSSPNLILPFYSQLSLFLTLCSIITIYLFLNNKIIKNKFNILK